MRILLVHHAIQLALVAHPAGLLGEVLCTCVLDQAVMLALHEQHGNVIVAHQRHGFPVSPVVVLLEELSQEQSDHQPQIIPEAVRSSGPNESDYIRGIHAILLLRLPAIAHDGCQMCAGRCACHNNLGRIDSILFQIADRGIESLTDVLELAGVFIFWRQSVAQRDETISLRADTLPHKIKEPGAARIPAAAMHPDNYFVTDGFLRLIIQEILLPAASIGNRHRNILPLHLEHLPVQPGIT